MNPAKPGPQGDAFCIIIIIIIVFWGCRKLGQRKTSSLNHVMKALRVKGVFLPILRLKRPL